MWLVVKNKNPTFEKQEGFLFWKGNHSEYI